MIRSNKESGFTLLELLLVVAAIAILATIVFAVLSPATTLNKFNNAKRTSDVQAILNAMSLYAVDNLGNVPDLADWTTAVGTPQAICTADTATGCVVRLTDLTLNSKYLIAVPTDPAYTSGNDTLYKAEITSTGVVTISGTDSDGNPVTAIGKFNPLP